jgi:hypothetical protein
LNVYALKRLIFVESVPATAAAAAIITTAAAAVVPAATAFVITTTAAAEAALFESTAAAGFVLGTCFVDDEFPSLHVRLVETGNGFQGFFVVFHFNKAKTFAATGFAVHNDFSGSHLAKLGKKVEQILVTEVEIHVANVNVHDKRFTNKKACETISDMNALT